MGKIKKDFYRAVFEHGVGELTCCYYKLPPVVVACVVCEKDKTDSSVSLVVDTWMVTTGQVFFHVNVSLTILCQVWRTQVLLVSFLRLP